MELGKRISRINSGIVNMKLGKSINNKHYNSIYDILSEEVAYEIDILRKNVDRFINNVSIETNRITIKKLINY